MGSSSTGGGFFDAQTSTKIATTSRRARLPVYRGNICRSPAAEGVFGDIVKSRGLDRRFCIDYAGTIDFHEGNLADSRMRALAKERGIEIAYILRSIRQSDFRDFDVILTMDKHNRAFSRWKFRVSHPENGHKKVRLMCWYCEKHNKSEVADPHYGGLQVLDLLEDACESLLESILAGNALVSS